LSKVELRAAQVGVLDSEGALDAEYLATQAWGAALADTFRVIEPSRLPRRLQHWDAVNHELPPVEEPLPVTLWKEWFAAIGRGEVDTPAPAIRLTLCGGL
jgi:hypothetical protein